MTTDSFSLVRFAQSLQNQRTHWRDRAWLAEERAEAAEACIEQLDAAVSRGAALVLAAELENERLRESVATLERLNNYKLIQLGGHHEASVLGRTLGITTVRAWGKPCPVCEHALAAADRPQPGATASSTHEVESRGGG